MAPGKEASPFPSFSGNGMMMCFRKVFEAKSRKKKAQDRPPFTEAVGWSRKPKPKFQNLKGDPLIMFYRREEGRFH